MNAIDYIDYSGAPFPVRTNFSETHNRFWNRLASPGAWLSGAQKVAIAKEIRQSQDCTLCQARKEALSPYQVAGTHDVVSNELSEAMIEVVHRIVTDSARLTKKWFDDIAAQGLKPQEYVEILGTIVHTFAIDEFCRGLGIPLNELPEPQSGEPTGYLPENSSYRSVKPMAMTLHIEGGKTKVVPWEIDYEMFNHPRRNAFYARPPEIEHKQ
jgi:hypothetical protein